MFLFQTDIQCFQVKLGNCSCSEQFNRVWSPSVKYELTACISVWESSETAGWWSSAVSSWESLTRKPLCDLDYCTGGALPLYWDLPASAYAVRKCFLLSKSGWFVSFSLFQHKPGVSVPHLELALHCISSEVLRPQYHCDIELITSALWPSLCSPAAGCFQNHRWWNDLKALYWPPAHSGPLLFFSINQPITLCVLSSELIGSVGLIIVNYKALKKNKRLQGFTAFWLMLPCLPLDPAE